MLRRLIPLLACLAILACGGNDDPLRPSNIESFRVEPADAELLVADGAVVSQAFTLIAVTKDGSELDVTDQAEFAIEDAGLGTFVEATLTADGSKAGRSIVTATVDSGSGSTEVTVRVQQTRLADGAPSNAPDLFDSGALNPSSDPSIVYPDAGTIMPPNVGDFEVHWTAGPGTIAAYELSLRSDYLDIVVYLPPNIDWSAFEPSEWAVAGQSQAGRAISAQLRSVTDNGAIGSAEVEVLLTPDDIAGGLYYWATANSGGNPIGIYRHDVARPAQAPEQFYTTAETPENRCVGCHALSRDGTRMAVRYLGNVKNFGSVVDVASGTEVLATDGTYQWNFSAFNPSGSHLVYGVDDTLTLLDVDTEIETPIPDTTNATQPDFSPDGTKLVYVKYATGNQIYMFEGSLVTRTIDTAGTFGAETVLVPSETMNVYYPTWSPDGQWILFNKSTDDSYDDPDAELWVVKADGTLPPIRLDVPTAEGDMTDSWARWAPFEQGFPTFEGGEQPLFWLTWSSKRAFGVRLPEGQPQLWMAPFFPLAAEAGDEPSAPAFRLPFQDIGSSNHIAQWTERVVGGIE
ncbi:MAG: PD40 domain-containing protein [Deltaproteobacteria bacterium]|nr:PD40 domain-containing protein [Deltaproteobacteria bacterium]